MTVHAQCLPGTQGLNAAAPSPSLTQNWSLQEAHQPSFSMGMAWAPGALQWLCVLASVSVSLSGCNETATRAGPAVQSSCPS